MLDRQCQRDCDIERLEYRGQLHDDCQASNASGTITFNNVTNVAVGCVSGQWTWTTGASTPGTLPVYGTLGLPSAANTPGSRVGAYTWTDAAGNLWLFGGQGRASASLYDAFSDLWKYAPATNQWTWVSGAQGSGASGVYGTQGHAAPTNDPGAREFGYALTRCRGEFLALWRPGVRCRRYRGLFE